MNIELLLEIMLNLAVASGVIYLYGWKTVQSVRRTIAVCRSYVRTPASFVPQVVRKARLW